jgi:hypothetical protein
MRKRAAHLYAPAKRGFLTVKKDDDWWLVSDGADDSFDE